MEIIVTDERDERFIKFCKSFGCSIDEPQVVLLLDNFGKLSDAVVSKCMTANLVKLQLYF